MKLHFTLSLTDFLWAFWQQCNVLQHLMIHKARRIDRAKPWVTVNGNGAKSALWLIPVIVHGQIREQHESEEELLSHDVRIPLNGWPISANYFWSSRSALEKKRATISTIEWVIWQSQGWVGYGETYDETRGYKSNWLTEILF